MNTSTLTQTIETIEWTPEGVVMIDQTRLPPRNGLRHLPRLSGSGRSHSQHDHSRRSAIGVAAAMGVAIGALKSDNLEADMPVICETLAKTRPTAVNLFWAIDRMKRVYDETN